MTFETTIPIAISTIALFISLITAYKTFFQPFSGQIWLGNYIILNHVNEHPSIALACFVGNTGAKFGILEDLRMTVEHRESGTSYKFFPIVMRSDYSILENYNEKDWQAFSGIALSPKSRAEKYIVFKPMIDQFNAQKGFFTISVQMRWYGSSKWEKLDIPLTIELTNDEITQWKEKKSLLIASNHIQKLR